MEYRACSNANSESVTRYRVLCIQQRYATIYRWLVHSNVDDTGGETQEDRDDGEHTGHKGNTAIHTDSTG